MADELGNIAQSAEQARTYQALLARVSGSGRRSNRRRIMDWVQAHLLTPVEGIEAEGVPDPRAVGLLMWARSGPAALAAFETKWMGPASAGRADAEAEGRLERGSRSLLELRAAYQAAVHGSGGNGHNRF